MKKLVVLLILMLSFTYSYAGVDSVRTQLISEHLFPKFPIKSSFTSIIDRLDRGYVYSASMEKGLDIYKSTGNSLTLVSNYMAKYEGEDIDISTIEQYDKYLYLGLGDFQIKDNPASGLAILDITNPESPVIVSQWDSTLFKHGISHLRVFDDYAYLSTMTDGIIILDVSDKSNIKFSSHLKLDMNFPKPSANAHNARGLDYRNDTLFVCMDRGGLRLVDVSDKQNPVELYKYINIDLNKKAAAAYNDVLVFDKYAVISVDYCGVEILDISSSPFEVVHWYDPIDCNFNNWSGSPIHANELKLTNNDSILFVSAGQSDLQIFDISEPQNFYQIGEYTFLDDTLATHGLDVHNGKISLSYLHTAVFVPLFMPFYSDPGGIKYLSYTVEGTKSTVDISDNDYTNDIYFDYSTNTLQLNNVDQESITIYDIYGKVVYAKNMGNKINSLDLSMITNGVYFITLQNGSNYKTFKIIK